MEYKKCLIRKPCDREGFYHPDSESGRNAAGASLDSLGLKARRKILFLYDFGDEWLFYVTVKRVETVPEAPATRVIQSSGRLEQYPVWDEDEWEEDLGGGRRGCPGI